MWFEIYVMMRWEGKRLKGCVFSRSSLSPMPGARERILSIASIPGCLLSKISLTKYFDVSQSTVFSIITGTAKLNVVCQYWVNLESFQILWIRTRAGINKSSTLDFFPRPIFWFTNRYYITFCSPIKKTYEYYISDSNHELLTYFLSCHCVN